MRNMNEKKERVVEKKELCSVRETVKVSQAESAVLNRSHSKERQLYVEKKTSSVKRTHLTKVQSLAKVPRNKNGIIPTKDEDIIVLDDETPDTENKNTQPQKETFSGKFEHCQKKFLLHPEIFNVQQKQQQQQTEHMRELKQAVQQEQIQSQQGQHQHTCEQETYRPDEAVNQKHSKDGEEQRKESTVVVKGHGNNLETIILDADEGNISLTCDLKYQSGKQPEMRQEHLGREWTENKRKFEAQLNETNLPVLQPSQPHTQQTHEHQLPQTSNLCDSNNISSGGYEGTRRWVDEDVISRLERVEKFILEHRVSNDRDASLGGHDQEQSFEKVERTENHCLQGTLETVDQQSQKLTPTRTRHVEKEIRDKDEEFKRMQQQLLHYETMVRKLQKRLQDQGIEQGRDRLTKGAAARA